MSCWLIVGALLTIISTRLTQSKSQVLQDLLLDQKSHSQLIQDIEYLVPSPPIVIKVGWRLDVMISSNDQSEAMKPVIVFKFTTTKGTYSCHCNLMVFHQLRVAVATSLKELYSLNPKNE